MILIEKFNQKLCEIIYNELIIRFEDILFRFVFKITFLRDPKFYKKFIKKSISKAYIFSDIKMTTYVNLTGADLTCIDLTVIEPFDLEPTVVKELYDRTGYNLACLDLSFIQKTDADLDRVKMSCVDLTGLELPNVELPDLSDMDLGDFDDLSDADLKCVNRVPST